MLLTFIILSQSAFAALDPNLDGGGGNLGQGTTNNGWAVSSAGGGLVFDADGLRIYLVNSSTGRPVSSAIDITTFNISTGNVINFNNGTKFDYNHVDAALNYTTAYNYVKVPASLGFPRIISNSMTSNPAADTARVDAIRDWFTDIEYYEWIIGQLGFSLADMQANGYMLALEPIAYFRYQGQNYAMTATEAALFDQLAGGALSAVMGPLTRQNLPLALFLEEDEFTDSPYRINEWTGLTNSYISNSNIVNQLGIGYISYFSERADIAVSVSFSYPADTWVVTAFRLCNVQYAGGSWVPGNAITSRNPASAQFIINGTTYNISNIYIPSGGEQLIWVKWRTPVTPRTVTATITSSTGYLYNTQNTGISDRYATTIIVSITIYSNDMENPPPDPTLDDTALSIGYTSASADSRKNTLLSDGTPSNSWTVWDCNFQLERTYTQVFPATGGYPSGDTYNEATGVFTRREVVSGSGDSVTVRFREYRYLFNSIIYTAEVRNSYVRIKPDDNCPTAYTRGGVTYMKSGYGINAEVEPFIRITMRHEGTSETSTNNYFSASSTNFAAAPQYIFAYFPEFRYRTYNRQLNFVNGRYIFRRNRFSTYNERTHYTPWWFPDNANYEIVVRSDFAYTPAGQLRLFEVSDAIRIDGNLMDDWRISPVR
jgi:hypothetical protein